MIRPIVKVSGNAGEAFLAMAKRMAELNDGAVDVGVHEDAGKYSGPGAPSVAQVALWHEFGTEEMPARPFLRTAIAHGTEKLNRWRVELIRAVQDGRMSVAQALAALGTRAASLVDRQIASNTPPPLSAAYAAWKTTQGKAPRTLILSGLLRRSISYRVKLGRGR